MDFIFQAGGRVNFSATVSAPLALSKEGQLGMRRVYAVQAMLSYNAITGTGTAHVSAIPPPPLENGQHHFSKVKKNKKTCSPWRNKQKKNHLSAKQNNDKH